MFTRNETCCQLCINDYMCVLFDWINYFVDCLSLMFCQGRQLLRVNVAKTTRQLLPTLIHSEFRGKCVCTPQMHLNNTIKCNVVIQCLLQTPFFPFPKWPLASQFLFSVCPSNHLVITVTPSIYFWICNCSGMEKMSTSLWLNTFFYETLYNS
jgi:hypothetical protein